MSRQTEPFVEVEDEDEWEYEYSSTETETYYLTLDLSVRDFLERRPNDAVIHNTRGGYRVWYNPAFNGLEPALPNLKDGNDNQDGEAPEREDRELDNIGLDGAIDEANPIDPMLEQSVRDKAQNAPDVLEEAAGEIQILELHSEEPLVSYRNHIFRGTWFENIGTEMIFTPHDDNAPLPALRNLKDGIDLLAASSTRIQFREATLRPKSEAELLRLELAREELNDEELPERYKKNGGVYVHVGGDKSGQRQPQAHFLEDLITLKRSRGETDDVTVVPSETRHNQLMVNDEEEERRRKKVQTDHARAVRWREIRKEAPRSTAPESNFMARIPPSGRGRGRGRGGSVRGRTRRPVLVLRQEGEPSEPPSEQPSGSKS